MMKYLLHVLIVLLLVMFQNCSTEIINPELKPVGLNFAPYNPAASSKITTQSVSGLTICIRYIRFKATEQDDVEPIEVNVGEVMLNPAGTAVADIEVPAGNYSRIEIELKKEFCSSELSVQVTNDNGSFSTDEDVKMAFDGAVSIDDENGLNLELYIQSIVSALQNVSSGEQIRDAVEGVTGNF